MPDACAPTSFIAVSAEHQRTAVSVRVGVPIQLGPNEWSCTVALEGLGQAAPIHGGDALQALALALRWLWSMLAAFEAQGGHFEFTTGDRVPLDAYFGIRADVE